MAGRARTTFRGARIERVAELHPVKDEYRLNNAAVKDVDQMADDDADLLGPTIDGAPRHDLRKLHVVDDDPDLDRDADPMLRGR